MRKIGSWLWRQYIDSINWIDMVHNQCRPSNLVAILFGVLAVEYTMYQCGLFKHWVYPIIATICVLIAFASNMVAWNIRPKLDTKKFDTKVTKYIKNIPYLIALDSIFYSSCASITALSLHKPYSYGMWALYLGIQIYWGTVSGFSVLLSLFLMGVPCAGIIITNAYAPDTALFWFGCIFYTILAVNSSKRMRAIVRNRRLEEEFKRLFHPNYSQTNQCKFNLRNTTKFFESLGYEIIENSVPEVNVNCSFSDFAYAVTNLMDNSIDAGATSMQVVFNMRTPRVLIDVVDNGGGIPIINQRHIFSPFESNKTTGLGLGLCTSKCHLQRHGGDLMLISSSNKLTRFRIELKILNDQ